MNTRYESKEQVGDTWATRIMVAAQMPHLVWRWHGIGLLQAYIHESESRELRVHVWSPRLMLAGIRESGNAHNHRFTLRSTVLVGALSHVEWHLTADDSGDYELYDFVHARLQTDDNRSAMRRLDERCRVRREPMQILAGSRYTFQRGAFHSSMPLSDVVVTLVEKMDQVETSARVVAPVATPPVPAFGGDDLGERNPAGIIEEARRLLQGEEMPNV